MLNKLETMLNENLGNIVINRFSELGEESMHLANLDNMFAIVLVNEDNEIEVYVEEYIPEDEDYNQIECRHYKTARGAYNYIKKMLP